jgi:hypothetical protein
VSEVDSGSHVNAPQTAPEKIFLGLGDLLRLRGAWARIAELVNPPRDFVLAGESNLFREQRVDTCHEPNKTAVTPSLYVAFFGNVSVKISRWIFSIFGK